jgi:hypothetical protein
MKILVVGTHSAQVGPLRAVLQVLDSRGHHVHLAFGGIRPAGHQVLQRLSDESRELSFGKLPSRSSPGWTLEDRAWQLFARRLRRDADFLRYLEPRYAGAPGLRRRAELGVDPAVQTAARVARIGGRYGVRALRAALRSVERCLPPPAHVERFLADFAPDLVVVTHLARDSLQVDYLRAAKRLGLHTAYHVFSWDNLTNKGLVHERPELVLVWNDVQAAEAAELHRIPRDRIRVTGAWSYDHWFDWSPSRTRGEFGVQIGLRADRPIVLYTCSSQQVASDEVAFVRRWLSALRARTGTLGEAGVLVRPHPQNAAQWSGVSLDDEQAVVWPPQGEDPLDVTSRRNYFDSIYHADAVVGINTSALIESAIVGRPVHTLLAEEFDETQEGTLHFRYLVAPDFGHVNAGRTMQEHLEQLEASLRRGGDDARNERFVQRFVRPFGVDVPAAPLYVEAIEELTARPAPSPARAPVIAPVVRRLLWPLAKRTGEVATQAKEERKAPAERDELRGLARTLRRKRADSRVVAAPWQGPELGELLYWIPFLRWLQATTYGLRERLLVFAPESSASWYADIGCRRVAPHDASAWGTDDFVLRPILVERHRRELAAASEVTKARRTRRLEFARLTAPEPPEGLDLPSGFVAASFTAEHDEVRAAVAERVPIVDLRGLDRDVQSGVLARSRGFIGTYGVEAHVALLLGLPAVALPQQSQPPDENDLRVVSAFLSRPEFGRLHLQRAGRPTEAAAGAIQFLGGSLRQS